MAEELQPAFDLATKVAFTDRLLQGDGAGALAVGSVNRHRDGLLQDAMRLDPLVTPALHEAVELVCARLKIPLVCVEVYVKAAAEVQAICWHSSDRCVVLLTSGIINLLNVDELNFVLGHEFGHWLMQHGVQTTHRESRANEISSDRVGLLACQSIDHATRAVMKTTSGLSGDHLRFDLRQFLKQLEDVSEADGASGQTHPANVLRCKALVAFETARRQGLSAQSLKTANEQVQSDLDRFHNGHEDRCLRRFRMWAVIHDLVVHKGRFSQADQKGFASMFGEEALDNMKEFLSLCGDQTEATVQQKVSEAASRLPGFNIDTIQRQAHRDFREYSGG